MWAVVEREAFSVRRSAGSPSWRVFATGVAAALMIGVGLGRFSATGPANVRTAVMEADFDSISTSGYERVASELLGRTVLLLSALPGEAGAAGASDQFAAQATDLLGTTRLLLDSPAADDVRFRNLLEDLELVLAQVAMLPSSRTREDLDFITNALEERDVVPRIRSAAARLSAGD